MNLDQYSIQIESAYLFIYGVGVSKNEEFCGAGNEYISSFNYKFAKNGVHLFKKQ